LTTDPTVVQSLSIFIEGEDNPVKTSGEIHQPDNLETTSQRAVHHRGPWQLQQFDAAQQVSDAARATHRAALAVQVQRRSPRRVAKVDQSADEGPTDVDTPTTAGPLGRVGVDGRRRRLVDLRSQASF
jgi:hypothetical protein